MKKVSFAVFCVIALISRDQQLSGQLPCGPRCVNVDSVTRRVLTGTPSDSIDFCDRHKQSAGWVLRTTHESAGAWRSLPNTHIVEVLASDACAPLCSPDSEANEMNVFPPVVLYTVNLQNTECYAFAGS